MKQYQSTRTVMAMQIAEMNTVPAGVEIVGTDEDTLVVDHGWCAANEPKIGGYVVDTAGNLPPVYMSQGDFEGMYEFDDE